MLPIIDPYTWTPRAPHTGFLASLLDSSSTGLVLRLSTPHAKARVSETHMQARRVPKSTSLILQVTFKAIFTEVESARHRSIPALLTFARKDACKESCRRWELQHAAEHDAAVDECPVYQLRTLWLPIQLIPTLGSKVYKHDLPLAIWSPMVSVPKKE